MIRGTIVLASYPFTDQSGSKRRPALVVSRSDRSDSDVILTFIGSYNGDLYSPTDLLIEDSDRDFSRTGLKKSSVVRLDKIMTIHRSLIRGELGELSASLIARADEKLRHTFELE